MSNQEGGRFRLGTNRKHDLSVLKELDDVAVRSSTEIAQRKSAKKRAPLTDEQKLAKSLMPEFEPIKRRKELKLHPIFHDDLIEKPLLTRTETVPNVPPYNPLEKNATLAGPRKTKKFPYAKEEAKTVEELTKPRVTSVGVTPTYKSKEVPGLKVVLEGSTFKPTIEKTLDQIETVRESVHQGYAPGPEAVQPPPNTTEHTSHPQESVPTHPLPPDSLPAPPPPPIPLPQDVLRLNLKHKLRSVGDSGSSSPSPRSSPSLSPTRTLTLPSPPPTRVKPEEDKVASTVVPRKPAIIASAGTTQVVQFNERPQPRAKESTLKTRRRVSRGLEGWMADSLPEGTQDSIASSLVSGEIRIPDEKVYSKYDEAIEKMDTEVETAVGMGSERPTSGTSSQGMKSVKDLLEEAKSIASPDAPPLYKKQPQPTASTGPTPRKKPIRRMSKDSSRKDASKQKGLGKAKGAHVEKKDEGGKGERTVDEIIASLKAQAKAGGMTESDRKIEEIMNRVLARDEIRQTAADQDSSKGPETIVEEEEQTEEAGDSVQKAVDEVVAAAQEAEGPSETDRSAETLEESKEEKELRVTFEMDAKAKAQREVDLQKAWEDLLVPPNATYEDILSVTGDTADRHQRTEPIVFTGSRPNVVGGASSFLSSWAPTKPRFDYESGRSTSVETPRKNVHHFCTATTLLQLPDQFRNIGRKYHTPDKFKDVFPDQPYRFGGPHQPPIPQSMSGSVVGEAVLEEDEEEERYERAADRVLDSSFPQQDAENFEAWQRRAEAVFSTPPMGVDGVAMPLKRDESRVYWDPAPPKLDVAPAQVKSVLFPEYQGRPAGSVIDPSMVDEESESESEEEEREEEEVLSPEDLAIHMRVIERRHGSCEDITELCKAKGRWESEVKEGRLNPYTGKQRLLPRPPSTEPAPASQPAPEPAVEPSLSSERSQEPETPKEFEFYPHYQPRRRAKSVMDLLGEEDESLQIPLGFQDYFNELQEQKKAIRQMKMKRKMSKALEESRPVEVQEKILDTRTIELEPPKQRKLFKRVKDDKPTPAEEALAAGRNYVILRKQKKKKRRGPVDMSRIEEVERFLRMPANKLPRTKSMTRLPKVLEWELRVPPRIRSKTRASLPDLLDFNLYKTKRNYRPAEEPIEREWVRSIWNKWFDQLYPPTPSGSEDEDDEPAEVVPTQTLLEKPKEEKKGKKKRGSFDEKDSMASILSVNMDSIEIIPDTEENAEIMEILMEEIEKLTDQINCTDRPLAFDLARRGALLRKVGRMREAQHDLNRALSMEPMLLDAYWHRHLIFLLEDKKQEALEDLQTILRYNTKHAMAYRGLAEIFRQSKDITMAIINYTNAIKYNPQDYDAYYNRAQMYELRGDMRLALEDLATVTKLNPSMTQALLKHADYYFKQGLWTNAIRDYTELLRTEPLNSTGRLFRGICYMKINQLTNAVEDLSAAIHLDPNNWEAFYWRACLLRKAHPKRALQDYSIALLLNDGENNISSYLHRGILYHSMDKPADAIPDFESVLKLSNDVAFAHVNLGLIYMLNYENLQRAIKKFTSAIKVDPTYVRAYVCRGEAYYKIHELKNALKDFTRAIHLRPDTHHFYMYRGKILLEMGNLNLAAFCVKHAAALSEGVADSSFGNAPTQQAVVQSFLKNYDKAMDALKGASRVKPGPNIFLLLGKTQMKAKCFSDAIQSFQTCLTYYENDREEPSPHGVRKPWKKWETWPMEAAEPNFLCGLCYMELRDYLAALEAFNAAVKIDSKMAVCYYHRGLARMKLNQPKGIQDFNRALALDPTIFQAYLSRACFYGMKGKYPKAILNCNEAIKLQPRSVRAYLYRGALKFYIKAYDLAIRDLTTAINIDTSCGLAFFNRAVCYQENKNYKQALMDYGIVLLLGDSMKLKVLINRGLLYFEMGDYRNAVHDFEVATSLRTTDHKLHHTLGLCYHKLGELKKAVATFSMCLKVQPFFLDGYIARGNVLMDFGHEEGIIQARRDYERAMRLDPMCLNARVNLAYTLQVTGKFMAAWRQFTAIITVRPRFKPALEGRAVVCLQMRDTFAAFQDISACINIAPTAELLTNRGVINQFMGDRVNAMRDYQRALQLDPHYSLAYFNAANVYFHTKHFRQALRFYDKAIEFNPKDESAILNRAICKVLMKDTAGALADFDAAIKLSPCSAHMYFNRGNLYASMQDFNKAETDYCQALEITPDDAMTLKRRADVRGKLGRKEEAVADYRRAIEIQAIKNGEF